MAEAVLAVTPMANQAAVKAMTRKGRRKLLGQRKLRPAMGPKRAERRRRERGLQLGKKERQGRPQEEEVGLKEGKALFQGYQKGVL